MPKLISKFLAIMLVIGLNMPGILAAQETLACFNDTEIADNNNLKAGILDFSVSSALDFSPQLNLAQATSSRQVALSKNGTLDFEYNVRTENLVGELCPSLDIKDHISDVFHLLSNYSSVTTSFAANSDVLFTVGCPSIDLSMLGKHCEFDLMFEAIQTGGVGFSDIERISSRVEAGSVVMNEFLPNAANYPEYIEIYNMTNSPVELAGFYIKANNNIIPINSSTTNNPYNLNPGSTSIPGPPNQWLVVL